MKVFLIILMLLTSVFAERNPLLNLKDDVRGVTNNLVDLGTKNDISNIKQNYNIQILSIPALVRNVDSAFQYTGRDLSEYNCIVDKFGHQSCPDDVVTCNANNIFNAGTATSHAGVVYTSKLTRTVTIGSGYSLNNSAINYPWGGILSSYAINVGTYNFKFYAHTAGTYNFNLQVDNYGTFSLNGSSILSTSNWPVISSTNRYLNVGEHSIRITSGNWDGPAGMAATIKFGGSVIWNTRTGQSPISTTEQYCPSGYMDNGTNCKKEYTYYTYSCPTSKNQYNQGWKGPLVNSGGDCNGEGISAATGGICPGQSSTPPAENCLRVDQSCPFEGQDCIQTSDGNVVAENVFEGYQYSIAASQEFTKTIKKAVECPNKSENDLVCPENYTKDGDGCLKEIIDVSDYIMEPENNKCLSGFFLEHNKCFRDNIYGNSITMKDNKYFYYTSRVANYDSDLKLCVSDKTVTCRNPNEILFDGMCIYAPACPFSLDGECYEPPVRSCKTGYSFNEVTKECVSIPSCTNGSLKPIVNSAGVVSYICESESTLCRTSGFTADKFATGYCSIDMNIDTPLCNGVVSTSNVCRETVTYDLWTEEGVPMAQWSQRNDGGEQTMYQHVNVTSGDTFYLYPETLTDFVLEGEIKTVDGDDDLLGFAFGYQNANNTYLIVATDASTSSVHMDGHMSQSDGLAVVKKNGVGNYTVIQSLGKGHGWTRHQYQKWKVSYSEGAGLKVYRNDVLKFDIPNLRVPAGKAGYFGFSQGQTYYKNFTIIKIPSCPSNYTYNANHNICYEAYSDSGYIYDFDNEVILEQSGCADGTYNSLNNTCETSPSCANNGVLKTVGNETVCSLPPEFKCESDNLIYENSSSVTNIFNTGSEYLKGACKVINSCKPGENSFYKDGIKVCSNTNFSTKCEDGYTVFNIHGEDKCIATPVCPDGYTKNGLTCELNYFWYEYSCPTGFEGPNEIWDKPDTGELFGGDCFGQCGFDGCKCNSENAPANSCRKSISINPNSITTTHLQKEKMMFHNISGKTLGADDMNLIRGRTCNSGSAINCQFALKKVEGKGSDLCFTKVNGENSCFTIDGCYFNGVIENKEAPINNLVMMNPYVLNSFVSCPANYSLIDNKCVQNAINKSMRISSWGFDDSSKTYGPVSINGTIIGNGGRGITVTILDDKLNLISSNNYDIHGNSGLNTQLFNYLNNLTLNIGNYFIITTQDEPSKLANNVGNLLINKFKATSLINNVYSNHRSSYLLISKVNGNNNIQRINEGFNGRYSSSSLISNHSISYCSNNSEPINGKCVGIDNASHGSIESTCKINGNVGWKDRNGVITSVGLSSEEGARFMAEFSGYGDIGNGSKWHGFNAATMAFRLTNGVWYTLANVLDENGNVIQVDKPSMVQPLGNNYFSISDSLINDQCFYKNKKLDPSMCGRSIVLRMPEKNLKVDAIADINSLYGLYGDTVNSGSLNIILSYGSITEDVQISGGVKNLNPNYTTIIKKEEMDILKNRLRFWDSYIDGYVGFLEFVNEVKPDFRDDGYVPEFFDYERAMGLGFTVIGLFSEKDGFLNEEELSSASFTYFVKPSFTSQDECDSLAINLGLQNITAPSGSDFNNKLSKILGMNYTGSCILGKAGVFTPNMSEWSIKQTSLDGNVIYQCSPYKCSNFKCNIASCKDGYIGTLLPETKYNENIRDGICMDDKCDKSNPYFSLCGKTAPCENQKNTFTGDDNKCKEYYCIDGYLDLNSQTCKIEKCPDGTNNVNGKCVK